MLVQESHFWLNLVQEATLEVSLLYSEANLRSFSVKESHFCLIFSTVEPHILFG